MYVYVFAPQGWARPRRPVGKKAWLLEYIASAADPPANPIASSAVSTNDSVHSPMQPVKAPGDDTTRPAERAISSGSGGNLQQPVVGAQASKIAEPPLVAEQSSNQSETPGPDPVADTPSLDNAQPQLDVSWEVTQGALPAEVAAASDQASNVTAPESTHSSQATVLSHAPAPESVDAAQVTVTSLTSVAETEPSKVEAMAVGQVAEASTPVEQEMGSDVNIAAPEPSDAPVSGTNIHQSAPLIGDSVAPGSTAPDAQPGPVTGDAFQAAVPAPDFDQPAIPVVPSVTASETSDAPPATDDMAVDEPKVCMGYACRVCVIKSYLNAWQLRT